MLKEQKGLAVEGQPPTSSKWTSLNRSALVTRGPVQKSMKQTERHTRLKTLPSRNFVGGWQQTPIANKIDKFAWCFEFFQTLREMYHDLEAKHKSYCPNEPEFRAYMVLMKLNEGDILRYIQ